MSVETKRALASVWIEPDVARLYRYRAPYPPVVFDLLRRLLAEPAVVLDAGCGTGALARYLTAFAARVDAIDPSMAMIAEGRGLDGGNDPRIRWIVGAAETAPLDAPYGLITCGKSIHWMDHDVVMPRFHDALAPGGALAAVDHEEDYPPLWRDRLIRIIERYSSNRPTAFADLFGELQRRGLFERHGSQRTSTFPFEQSVEDFVRALQSTSTLSRVTLGERTDAFAAEVRGLFATLGVDRVAFPVAGHVVWGRPLRP
ncbi:MAG TPA: class I SAM-dependent methyltransferase [Candidatus Limnocylindria bacterium]|nr:class I SAM-dependent methyltransferase [Candidatus Limnocylindria bacterium]